MDSSKAARNLRKRIARFSGDLSKGLCKRAQVFVSEMVYGMQAAESVLLTEIGRTLEEPTSLKKTEERLSRHLMRPELEDVIQHNVLRMAKGHIGKDTLLLVDPSDLSKKYAKKMEYLATVRDGSTGELGPGYHTLHIVGAELDSKRIVPLYQHLWSCDAPGFESENVEILRGIDAVMAHVGHNGIFVYDRGGDRIKLFGPLLDREARFLVRLVGNRDLIYNRQCMLADEVAYRCPCLFAKTIVRIDGEKERVYNLKFGFRKVRLPDRPEALHLLVIHGFGSRPSMFLTTEPLRRSFKCLWRFVRIYTRRWAIEETIRYAKTCYELENVRVLNYQGLQNIMPLLLAVMFFCACVLDSDQRLRIMAQWTEKAAKRLFGIPDFKYYALADGMRALFTRHPGAPQPHSRSPNNHQLDLLMTFYG